MSLKFAMKETDLLLKYLRLHPQVTDVVFTGGDPMTMSASLLSAYIEPLLQPGLEHIRTIRIGSKALAYWPYRFISDVDAAEVLRLFEKVTATGKNLSFSGPFQSSGGTFYGSCMRSYPADPEYGRTDSYPVSFIETHQRFSGDLAGDVAETGRLELYPLLYVCGPGYRG